MRAIRQLLKIFIVLIMTAACSGAPIKMSEKYNLDNQLENVPKICDYYLNSWQSIDYQSFILETSINSYYLLILNTPDYKLPFRETIQISNANAMIRPGYDNVNSYGIYKIYKFKNHEQVNAIKTQLSGGMTK